MAMVQDLPCSEENRVYTATPAYPWFLLHSQGHRESLPARVVLLTSEATPAVDWETSCKASEAAPGFPVKTEVCSGGYLPLEHSQVSALPLPGCVTLGRSFPSPGTDSGL